MNDQFHAPAALAPKKISYTQWIGGWVGSRAGLDAVENRKALAPTVNRSPKNKSEGGGGQFDTAFLTERNRLESSYEAVLVGTYWQLYVFDAKFHRKALTKRTCMNRLRLQAESSEIK
jgi:hypothetical protein